MADQNFVHLHLHTEYSLLDGACRIDELLDQASRLKMPALAVTEHGNMFSSVIFHDHAKQRGVKPILGCEVYVAPGDRRTKSGTPGETANHLVLLAETNEGYHNLIKLVSAGYTEGFYYKPRIDKELLAHHAKGLIGLSSCLKGEVASEIRTGRERKALEAAATFQDILGAGNFFLEMQYQGIDEQLVVNKGLVPIARELDMPLVGTNDVHYLMHGDHHPHDILLCIGTGKTVNDRDRMRYHGDQFYLKTAAEMSKVFGEVPEAMSNTVRIAERCNVDIPTDKNFLPNFAVPAPYTLNEYFEHVVREGFAQRLSRLRTLRTAGSLRHPIEDYEKRLSYEIEMIKRMDYPGYFLIVWDFIRYARERSIPVGPGRGSAAGSLVAYCLRITDVDPLDYDLIFERFLNPERVSLPDIDIDFCERRRGEVIEYVTQKYGRENVAQIITFGTMKARAVVRDVGRSLDIPFAEVDRVAKLIPGTLDMTLDKALEEVPQLKQASEEDPRVKELLAVARRLEGMTRHASVHAAGVVIAPRAITEFAPLYKGKNDEITTQWAMKEIERIGLLKMDFLGLSTLTLLNDAVEEIRATTGEVLDLDTIRLDDPKTYQIFADGQTYGIFQFESSGMRDILRKAKPQRLDDLIALNALYRPGPLRSGMVDDFIARKHGKVKVSYEVKELEPILADTYGVIAYQEQVMRIASVLAGFTLGEADLLRKAMGKKKADVMQAQRQKFVEGAVKRGINEKKATKIFDLMEHFAGYGFNKSHSTAYALLAYQTAYLKANYPWHFAAALLTIESQNTDKLAMYLAESRERGVPVLPPDINKSQLAFTVTPEGVRFGLTAIRNVGEGAIASILGVRAASGKITSLHGLCADLDLRLVNKRVLESLVKAGALDSLAPPADGETAPGLRVSRARLMATIDLACEHGARRQRDRDLGQAQLFAGSSQVDGEEVLDPTLAGPANVEPWTEAQQLAYEKEALGLYWSGHPIDRVASELKALGAKTTADLASVAASGAESGNGDGGPPYGRRNGGVDVAVGGIVGSIRQLKTRKGDRMAVIMLEDPHGSIEVVIFPEAYAKSASVLESGAMVVVKGKVELDEETVRMMASDVMPIDAMRQKMSKEMSIKLTSPPHGRATFEALADLFAKHRGDRRVVLELELRDQQPPIRLRAPLAAQVRVQPSDQLASEVERICGAGTVVLR
ncbi:MAG: DNA polymerase III subunit alpha [Vicinamibacterales bacterium]|nr:DNA polymerase III subunit alpha [Vicinamibacterales bacterium]